MSEFNIDQYLAIFYSYIFGVGIGVIGTYFKDLPWIGILAIAIFLGVLGLAWSYIVCKALKKSEMEVQE